MVEMRKTMMAIPVMILSAAAVILLTFGVFRAIFVLIYLSFVPGFVLLKVFKLKEISFLNTFLFSVGLSIVASMFVGLLVNELYIILGLSEPLSVIPLTVAMSTFTLIVFFIGYRRSFSLNFDSLDEIGREIKSHLPLILVLILLPLLGIFGALYVNIPIMIFLSVIIAVLCVLSVASGKLVPRSFFPFLIFSISIAILCLNVLLSKHIIGGDDSLEYYLFRVAQIGGYWGPVNPVTNSWTTLTFNSMLSVTLLPNVYSALMGLQGEIVFKILYIFIFSLVPLILFGIYEKQTGKIIGFLSTLFFVFTVNAFFGELTTVNRQIVAVFFLVLSIYIWLDKTLPTTKKRLLLIVFGVALVVSHYSIAYIYLGFVVLVVLISSVKTKFDDMFNAVTCVFLFGVAFLWYAFTNSSSVLTGFTRSIQAAVAELTNFQRGLQAGASAGVIYGLPKSFTVASWINLAVSGIATLFLITGFLVVLLRSRRIGISDQFRLLMIVGGVILFVSLAIPNIAATLNFTRFYAIAFLFISPCFVLGGKFLLETIRSAWMKINETLKRHSNFENTHTKAVLLLVAVLLSAYFLSQSGFVNYVTGGAIHSATFDFYRMKTSSDPQVESQFYGTYIQESDAFSAYWLSKYASNSSIVYADSAPWNQELISCALIPSNLILPLTNVTKPEQGSFIYLDTLNVAKGIVPASTGLFNTSEIVSSLDESNLIYSNGNSQVWGATG
jgi:uncharacterized membrane protein